MAGGQAGAQVAGDGAAHALVAAGHQHALGPQAQASRISSRPARPAHLSGNSNSPAGQTWPSRLKLAKAGITDWPQAMSTQAGAGVASSPRARPSMSSAWDQPGGAMA